jgi:hypothetical protein
MYEDIETGHPSRIDALLEGSSEKSVSNFELKLSLWLAENNLPLYLSDSLLDTLKASLREDKIVQNSTLGKTKCTNIVRQVLGFSFMKDSI